jgi:hypothetical protein
MIKYAGRTWGRVDGFRHPTEHPISPQTSELVMLHSITAREEWGIQTRFQAGHPWVATQALPIPKLK